MRGELAFELGLSAVRLEEMDETKQESSKSSHRYGSFSRSSTSLDIQVNHGADTAIELLGCQVE